MRGYRANLRRARNELAVKVHSGIVTEIRTGPDGKPGLYVGAKFNDQQLAAITELAEAEGADPEELIEDMLHQLALAWRRQRKDGK